MAKNNFESNLFPLLTNSYFDDIENGIMSPLSHLQEFDSYWKLDFDLPLVNKKDIKVSFNENMISIEAKLKETYSEEKSGTVSKFEYFKKSLLIPGKINSKKTKAKFQNGRLEIKIPKKTLSQTVKID